MYTTEEEAEFVGNYLGEALEKAGLSDVDIFVWDHNKEILFERFGTCIQNEKAANISKVLPYTGIPEIILRQLKWYKNSIRGQK